MNILLSPNFYLPMKTGVTVFTQRGGGWRV